MSIQSLQKKLNGMNNQKNNCGSYSTKTVNDTNMYRDMSRVKIYI